VFVWALANPNCFPCASQQCRSSQEVTKTLLLSFKLHYCSIICRRSPAFRELCPQCPYRGVARGSPLEISVLQIDPLMNYLPKSCSRLWRYIDMNFTLSEPQKPVFQFQHVLHTLELEKRIHCKRKRDMRWTDDIKGWLKMTVAECIRVERERGQWRQLACDMVQIRRRDK